VIVLVLLLAPSPSEAVKAAYLYTLSSFTGPIPYNHSRITADRFRNETYVLYQNSVRIFNESGMEVYAFGDDLDLGHIVDIAVEEAGDILLLAYKDSQVSIIRCNYRGEPRSMISLANLPEEYRGFAPNRMVAYGDSLYLASFSQLKVVVADAGGEFKRGHDVFSLFDLEEKDRGNVELGGFAVDGQGNILLTVPVLFTASVLSPDGKVRSWGKPGGAPGRFNVIGGIAGDSKGNYLVVDKLKAAVSVFDRNLNFVIQFGSRGYKAGGLIFPDDIAIDGGDRVYVTQMGKRGVSVWKLAY
jgi:hypothetical protein